MAEDFSLPDPLPEMLPDESRADYKHRVIPAWTEFKRLLNQRRAYTRRVVAAVKREHPEITEEAIHEAVLAGRLDWDQAHPESCARLRLLRDNVHTVVWDE